MSKSIVKQNCSLFSRCLRLLHCSNNTLVRTLEEHALDVNLESTLRATSLNTSSLCQGVLKSVEVKTKMSLFKIVKEQRSNSFGTAKNRDKEKTEGSENSTNRSSVEEGAKNVLEPEENLYLSMSETDEIFPYVKEFASVEENMDKESKLKEFIGTLVEKKKVVLALNYIINAEVKVQKLSLLRQESIGISLLRTLWFEFEGKHYLRTLIAPLIKDVKNASKSKPLEIDNKRADIERIKKNTVKMIPILQRFCDKLFHSYDDFPQYFLRVLLNLYKLITEAEGASKSHLGLGFSEVALQKFGGFLLLRFICPAIVSPQRYGIIKKEPKENASRSLILVSKILQGVGNQVDFGGEAHLKLINDFVLNTMPSLLQFLSTLMIWQLLNRIHSQTLKDEERVRKIASPKAGKYKEEATPLENNLSKAGFL